MKKLKSLILLSMAAVALAGSVLPSVAAGKEKTKAYPLKTCIVTDNELGSMGSPITKVHEGQTVKFCCKPCVKEFGADPAKFLPKLEKK